jgi:hypothetical protein
MERKRRNDRGPRVTDRDLDALQWIAQQYAVSFDHLCILALVVASTDAAIDRAAIVPLCQSPLKMRKITRAQFAQKVI